MQLVQSRSILINLKICCLHLRGAALLLKGCALTRLVLQLL